MRTMKSLRALTVVGALLMAATPSLATVLPVKIRMVEPSGPARSFEPFSAVIEIEVLTPIVIDGLEIAGSAWQLTYEAAAPGTRIEPGQPLRVPIHGVAIDASQPFVVRVEAMGRVFQRVMRLSLADERRSRLPRLLVEREASAGHRPLDPDDSIARPEPAAAPAEAPKDRSADQRTIPDESHDTPARESAKRGGYSITVEGRFIYVDRDGNLRGVDAATARVYDEDSGVDELLSTVLTERDGYFTSTFTWDPGPFDDATPDLYVEFELVNSVFVVEDAGVFKYDYTFVTGTWGDYGGSHLDIGWRQPADESLNPAPHIFTMGTRVWRFVNAHGYNAPQVDAMWPADGTFYDGEISVSAGRQWEENVLAHEYGHHVVRTFGSQVPAVYCNGICDDPGDCGHCIWCEETDHNAFSEGWPDWLGGVFVRTHAWTYGYDPLHVADYDFETLGACQVTTGKGCPCDPNLTEGFFAALLQDIQDEPSDRHFTFPDGDDELALGTFPLFTVALADDPTTPWTFINAFRARYPEHDEAFWATVANCGWDFDATPPGVVTNLTSPSHTTTGDSPDARVDFTWNHAPDDASGIAGYSHLISNLPTMPSATRTISAVESYTTFPIDPGTYYFNLRAQDRSGRWSSTYATWGPFTIREPTPNNLVFETGAGWADALVPRADGDATESSVPPPTSLPNSLTYWNFRVRNAGEITTGSPTRTGLYLDGRSFSTLLDPERGTAPVPPLLAGEHHAALNLEPLPATSGRHTLSAHADVWGQVAESNENDNVTGRQWIWDPWLMPEDGAFFQLGLPDRDGGWEDASGTLWFNCRGFRMNGTGWWNAAWMYPNTVDTNYDLRLHPLSAGPLDGFGANIGWSTRGEGCLDAVIVNRNTVGPTPQLWDVGVLETEGVAQVTGFTVGHARSVLVDYDTAHADTVHAYDMILLREFYVPLAGGFLVELDLDDPSAGALQLVLLDRTFATGSLTGGAAWVETDGTGHAQIEGSADDEGFYCVAIVRDPKDVDVELAAPLTFVARPLPANLAALTPVGWHAPLVPRAADDGSAGSMPAPVTLSGGGSTWLNVAMRNDSNASVPGDADAAVYRDGAVALELTATGPIDPHANAFVLKAPPVSIPGGRHSLGLVLDHTSVYDETSETDNAYGEQWSWAPSVEINWGIDTVHPQPPDPIGGFDLITTGEFTYNASGHKTQDLTPVGEDGWWVVACTVPLDTDTNVDLRLHAETTDAKLAFTSPLALSGWGPGFTDFVIVDSNLLGVDRVDLGVTSLLGEGGYTLELQRSTFLGNDPAGTFGPYGFGEESLVGIHEAFLSAGSHRVLVTNFGDADLGVSIFVSGGLGAHGKSDAYRAEWFAPAGEDETVIWTSPEDGYHAICVWKVGIDDLPMNGDYELNLGQVVSAPEVTVARTELGSVAPNPFNPQTRISYALLEASDVALTIYGVNGERVRTLRRASMSAGRHTAVWDGRDDAGLRVGSGRYFLELRVGEARFKRTLTLLK